VRLLGKQSPRCISNLAGLCRLLASRGGFVEFGRRDIDAMPAPVERAVVRVSPARNDVVCSTLERNGLRPLFRRVESQRHLPDRRELQTPRMEVLHRFRFSYAVARASLTEEY
jgi:hypothetical protein